MDLMFRLVYGTACRSTHHKFALDALKRLDADLREPWLNPFLLHYDDYLRGAKDPDDRFRDFTNHVLHVGEGNWGGAIAAAEKWYGVALETLRQRDWGHAVYACGVLSHYVTDPVMPFHTAQTDREKIIHRACEWSIWRSYDSLHKVTLLRHGYPEINLGQQPNWLAQAVLYGAQTSYQHYASLSEHFLFDRAVRDPEAGLDPVCREIIAKLFGVSIQLWASILSRLLREAAVTPPHQDLSLSFLGALLDAPRSRVVAAISNRQEYELVSAIYDEWKQTGTVEKHLPLDDRMVQQAYDAEQVARAAYGPYTPPAILVKKPQQEATLRHQQTPVERKPTTSLATPNSNESRPVDTSEVEPVSEAAQVSRQQVPKPHFGARREAAQRSADSREETSQQQPSTEIRRDKATESRGSDEAKSSDRRSVQSDLRPQAKSAGASNQHEVAAASDSYYLAMDDDVERAPSIGPKTAKRLAKVGVGNVRQLLEADAETLSTELEVRWITPELIVDWQDQARLMCRIPELRGQAAQWLVAVGRRDTESVASSSAADLLAEITAFAATSQGQSILRDGKEPDRAQIERWIASARSRRAMSPA